MGQSFSSKPMPLLRQTTTTGTERRSLDLPMLGIDGSSSGDGNNRSVRSGSFTNINDHSNTARRDRMPSGATIDAQWIEMQNTLGEVELSGANGGASVFSQGHARALEELRRAQIALAQAWTRSETEDVDADGDITNVKKSDGAPGNTADVLATDRSEKLKQKHKDSGGAGSGKTKLQEETENDIDAARKRRAANDRYFERVSKGVVDVVEKLDAVAKKMRGVEMESKEIWGSEDTVDEDESIGG